MLADKKSIFNPITPVLFQIFVLLPYYNLLKNVMKKIIQIT